MLFPFSFLFFRQKKNENFNLPSGVLCGFRTGLPRPIWICPQEAIPQAHHPRPRGTNGEGSVHAREAHHPGTDEASDPSETHPHDP